eukprot:scaffold518_cov388-Prasinococcus_capsulatus_cf.AAC.11
MLSDVSIDAHVAIAWREQRLVLLGMPPAVIVGARFHPEPVDCETPHKGSRPLPRRRTPSVRRSHS